MSKNETVSEYNRLKRAWKKWNASCHPDDQISWDEFLEEHWNSSIIFNNS
tara:strand:- start:7309 stop:7458 length:150 start_codon:yes stop_codon:yes gene_type:complete